MEKTKPLSLVSLPACKHQYQPRCLSLISSILPSPLSPLVLFFVLFFVLSFELTLTDDVYVSPTGSRLMWCGNKNLPCAISEGFRGLRDSTTIVFMRGNVSYMFETTITISAKNIVLRPQEDDGEFERIVLDCRGKNGPFFLIKSPTVHIYGLSFTACDSSCGGSSLLYNLLSNSVASAQIGNFSLVNTEISGNLINYSPATNSCLTSPMIQNQPIVGGSVLVVSQLDQIHFLIQDCIFSDNIILVDQSFNAFFPITNITSSGFSLVVLQNQLTSVPEKTNNVSIVSSTFRNNRIQTLHANLTSYGAASSFFTHQNLTWAPKNGTSLNFAKFVVQITNSYYFENSLLHGSGGGIAVLGSFSQINLTKNSFYLNTLNSGQGGAVFISSTPRLDNKFYLNQGNYFYKNSAVFGGAIASNLGIELEEPLATNSFVQNSAISTEKGYGGGGGIFYWMDLVSNQKSKVSAFCNRVNNTENTAVYGEICSSDIKRLNLRMFSSNRISFWRGQLFDLEFSLLDDFDQLVPNNMYLIKFDSKYQRMLYLDDIYPPNPLFSANSEGIYQILGLKLRNTGTLDVYATANLTSVGDVYQEVYSFMLNFSVIRCPPGMFLKNDSGLCISCSTFEYSFDGEYCKSCPQGSFDLDPVPCMRPSNLNPTLPNTSSSFTIKSGFWPASSSFSGLSTTTVLNRCLRNTFTNNNKCDYSCDSTTLKCSLSPTCFEESQNFTSLIDINCQNGYEGYCCSHCVCVNKTLCYYPQDDYSSDKEINCLLCPQEGLTESDSVTSTIKALFASSILYFALFIAIVFIVFYKLPFLFLGVEVVLFLLTFLKFISSHFLSDILFTAMLTYLSTRVSNNLFYKDRPAISSFVFYLQTLNVVLKRHYFYKLPDWVLIILNFFNFVNLKVSGMECYILTFREMRWKLMLLGVVPWILITLALVALLLVYVWEKILNWIWNGINIIRQWYIQRKLTSAATSRIGSFREKSGVINSLDSEGTRTTIFSEGTESEKHLSDIKINHSIGNNNNNNKNLGDETIVKSELTSNLPGDVARLAHYDTTFNNSLDASVIETLGLVATNLEDASPITTVDEVQIFPNNETLIQRILKWMREDSEPDSDEEEIHKPLTVLESLSVKISSIVLFTLYISYFPLCSQILKVFAPCQSQYMFYYPWIHCDSHEFSSLWYTAWFLFVFYIIGIPVLFGMFVIVNRKRIQANDPILQKWLGFFFLSFKPQFYWFNFIWLMRALSLSVIFSLLEQRGDVQRLCLMLVMVGSAAMVGGWRPYNERTWSNVLEAVGIGCLIITISVSQWKRRETVVDTVVMILNSITVALFVYDLCFKPVRRFYHVVRGRKEMKTFKKVL